MKRMNILKDTIGKKGEKPEVSPSCLDNRRVIYFFLFPRTSTLLKHFEQEGGRKRSRN